jgi:hypothetical protein
MDLAEFRANKAQSSGEKDHANAIRVDAEVAGFAADRVRVLCVMERARGCAVRGRANHIAYSGIGAAVYRGEYDRAQQRYARQLCADECRSFAAR